MSSDIVITITNPDGLTVEPVMVDLPTYDEYLDKPRKFTAKIEKSCGLDPKGTVKVTRRGKIILLGHVKKLDESKRGYDTLILESAEALLDDRIGQFWRFPAGTTLGAMLQKLIDMANGLIPRGSWSLHSGSVYKITGAGTSSRFGTLTTIYQGDTLLTKHTAIPNAAGKWYQSSTDLYVWTTDSRSPLYHLIIASLWKDTLLRLGTISLTASTFAVCYEVGETKLWPVLKSLVLAAGLEYTIRYEKDGYAYLDASAAIGLGSASAPVATYIDEDNADISIDQIDGQGNLQALIGQGAGAGMSQQSAASLDLDAVGTWREGIYRAGGLFGSMLQTATAKVFSDFADPVIYKVGAAQDWAQGIGNLVEVRKAGMQPAFKRIKHISMKSGRMELEVGQRLQTLQELLKAEEEVQSVLASFYGAHTKNAWSWSLPDTNIDSYSPCTHKFLLASTDDSVKASDDPTIGQGEIDPNFPFQVLLSIRIDWFKSSVNSATVSGPSHSNVGSHAGYGGEETSDEEMTAHAVPAVTTAATSALLGVAGSGHTHTTGAGSGSVWVLDYVSVAFDTDSYAPLDYDYVWWVWIDDYDTSLVSTYNHTHTSGFPSAGGWVPDGAHTHPIASHYTNAAANQSHTEALKSAKTRGGSSQHADQVLQEDAGVDFQVNELATGSVRLMSFAVTVNGSAVPGSPFTDDGAGLYIGDSIDNIDITDLVIVGQENTIIITPSHFGGSSLVKCSITGTVNVSAIISAF